jgi:hypothetical protein
LKKDLTKPLKGFVRSEKQGKDRDLPEYLKKKKEWRMTNKEECRINN